jgi:hypothetical protein
MRTLVVLLLAIALLFAAVFADEVAVQEEQMSMRILGLPLPMVPL